MSIDQKELARRLRAAREQAGATQDQAALAAGIPRPSIAQIESGKRAVSGIELDRLAFLYGRDVRNLLEVTPIDGDPVALFRHDADLVDLPELREALNECLRFGRDLATLERLTGVDRTAPGAIRYDLPSPATIGVAIAQGTRTADAERRRLGLSDAPIEDLMDLLEGNGVRTAILAMPDAISGLMLAEAGAAPLVVANRAQHVGRRTFSFAHEYAHALFDREHRGLVSRDGESGDLREIRANFFAAAFLMPETGLRRRLAEFGKSGARPTSVAPDRRTRDATPPHDGSAVGLHDVAVLAGEFKVTRAAMINRLRSLKVLSQKQADAMREDDVAKGRAIARLLGLIEQDHADERERSRRRFSRLALEAFALGAIDASALSDQLVRNAGMGVEEIAEAIGSRRIGGRKPSTKPTGKGVRPEHSGSHDGVSVDDLEKLPH